VHFDGEALSADLFAAILRRSTGDAETGSLRGVSAADSPALLLVGLAVMYAETTAGAMLF